MLRDPVEAVAAGSVQGSMDGASQGASTSVAGSGNVAQGHSGHSLGAHSVVAGGMGGGSGSGRLSEVGVESSSLATSGAAAVLVRLGGEALRDSQGTTVEYQGRSN